MAHNVTTTLSATAYSCGMATSWNSTYSNMSSYSDSCAGYDGGERYARAISFNATTLAALKKKTIVSITLTVYMDWLGSSVNLAISHKANGTTSSVTRGTAITTFYTASKISQSGKYANVSFNLTSGGIPTYGYVIGLAGNTTTNGWANCSTTTLTVVTSEPDTYTVSYNKGANGTGTNVSDTKTEDVSLTLRGAIFTRTNYVQDGWSTSDGGAKAYELGAAYTSNTAVTLYPHWKQTVSDVKIKVSNSYKSSVGYVKASGVYNPCIVYVKVNDQYKQV